VGRHVSIPIVSSLAKDIANAFFGGAASWMVSGANWVLIEIGRVLSVTTHVDLAAPWFLTRSRVIDSFLPLIALAFLVVAVIQALLRQDLALLLRIMVVSLPASIVLAGSAVDIASLGLVVTDQLSAGMSAGSGQNIKTVTSLLASAMVKLTESGSSVPSFIVALLGLLVVIASLVLWIELIIRASALYVVVAFLPLALLTILWPAVSAWARRLVETLVALMLSKLVIVVVLSLGVGALSSARSTGVSAVLLGLAMVVLAAFAPFVLFRLIPMVESGALASLQGLRQHAQRVVQHGSARSASTFAIARLSQAGPPPLAMSTRSHARAAGVRDEGDPMRNSAVQRAREAPPQRNSGPSLDIGRDAMGPVIQPRKPRGTDRG